MKGFHHYYNDYYHYYWKIQPLWYCRQRCKLLKKKPSKKIHYIAKTLLHLDFCHPNVFSVTPHDPSPVKPPRKKHIYIFYILTIYSMDYICLYSSLKVTPKLQSTIIDRQTTITLCLHYQWCNMYFHVVFHVECEICSSILF